MYIPKWAIALVLFFAIGYMPWYLVAGLAVCFFGVWYESSWRVIDRDFRDWREGNQL